MGEEFNLNSVDIEGSDQVGKGDAVRNIALELAENGIDTTVISFPYYSTPIGYMIRRILTDGIDNQIEIENDRKVAVKMALFALNRLEILNCILAEQREGIYLFDRGPFSNALTIAYSMMEDTEQSKIPDLVNIAMDLDRYFRRVLNIDNCVIRLRTEGIEWTPGRQEQGDRYERKEVQENSEIVYKEFEQRVGNGWKNITTKNINGWRPREDITRDCIAFVGSKIELGERGGGRLRYLSLDLIIGSLYTGSNVSIGDKERWLAAIRENDKAEIYSSARDISVSLMRTVEKITWYNREIILEVRRILDLYPEVLYIIEDFGGEEFLLNFLNSLNG